MCITWNYHILGLGCICLMHYDSYRSAIVILVYLVVHPYALGPCGDCLLLLFATIDPPSEFEEGCEGETFAGEAEEELGTTGKPPLALAFLYTYIACICFGFKNYIIPIMELPVA